jgi:hypothetical protein
LDVGIFCGWWLGDGGWLFEKKCLIH